MVGDIVETLVEMGVGGYIVETLVGVCGDIVETLVGVGVNIVQT